MKQKLIHGLIVGAILLFALGARNWRKRKEGSSQ